MVWSENETTQTLPNNRWAVGGEGSGYKIKTMFVCFIHAEGGSLLSTFIS